MKIQFRHFSKQFGPTKVLLCNLLHRSSTLLDRSLVRTLNLSLSRLLRNAFELKTVNMTHGPHRAPRTGQRDRERAIDIENESEVSAQHRIINLIVNVNMWLNELEWPIWNVGGYSRKAAIVTNVAHVPQ